MRAFVAERSFAQITCVADGRPCAAYAPLSFASDGSLRFHLTRTNTVARVLDGAEVLATLSGPDGYVSPDWYGTADQVPTWNYVVVEVTGTARRLDEEALRRQVDEVSAAQEAQLAPKPAWTSAKMDQRKFALMLRAIVGFTIDAPLMRGVRKLGQNKTEAEAAGAIAALHARGQAETAQAMREAR
jgi:transcriptional regulator